jgi:hypothetical protein
MILVWRGWGLLALVALFLPLASCAGFVDWNPAVAVALGGLTLAVGGLACVRYGRKWNRGSGFHTMYWVPVEHWGWVYIGVGGLLGLAGLAVVVKKAVAG